MTMPKQKLFDELLIFVNLYQHAKNIILLICSEKIVDLKILQSNWLTELLPISQEQDFSQYSVCPVKQQTIKYSLWNKFSKN